MAATQIFLQHILVILFLCSLLSLSAWAGNCTNADSFILRPDSGKFVFQTEGISGTLSSALNGQVLPSSINITITPSHVIEREKNISMPEKYICKTPTGFYEPDAPVHSSGQPFAPPINILYIEQYDCYTYKKQEIRNGVKIDGIYTVVSNTTFPDFRFHFNYEISNDTLYEFPNNDTTYTAGEIYSYKWMYVKKKRKERGIFRIQKELLLALEEREEMYLRSP
jgi:hypothetical protein